MFVNCFLLFGSFGVQNRFSWAEAGLLSVGACKLLKASSLEI